MSTSLLNNGDQRHRVFLRDQALIRLSLETAITPKELGCVDVHISRP